MQKLKIYLKMQILNDYLDHAIYKTLLVILKQDKEFKKAVEAASFNADITNTNKKFCEWLTKGTTAWIVEQTKLHNKQFNNLFN